MGAVTVLQYRCPTCHGTGEQHCAICKGKKYVSDAVYAHAHVQNRSKKCKRCKSLIPGPKYLVKKKMYCSNKCKWGV